MDHGSFTEKFMKQHCQLQRWCKSRRCPNRYKFCNCPDLREEEPRVAAQR
ncbi:unnamed protein product [Lepidochelys kempii]